MFEPGTYRGKPSLEFLDRQKQACHIYVGDAGGLRVGRDPRLSFGAIGLAPEHAGALAKLLEHWVATDRLRLRPRE